MKIQKSIYIVFAVILALGVLAPASWASEWDQATKLTFDQPFQIPNNVVLPAGTYWFSTMDSPLERNVVQIFDNNHQLITTMLTIPTDQVVPSDETELTFAERSGNQPDALLKWFYPGNTIGHEFIYSGPEGRALSEQTVGHVTVLANASPAPAESNVTYAQR